MDVFRPFSFSRFAFLVPLSVLCLAAFVLEAPQSQAQPGGAIKISSTSQTYQLGEGSSQFDGNVKIAMEGTEITAPHANIQLDAKGKPDSAVFTSNPKMVRKSGDMKQTIQAGTLKMGLQNGSLDATGGVTTKMTGDAKMGDIAIQSDSQAFDQDKHIMRAIGHVSIKKDDMVATSPEALIFMSPTGSAEKVIFIKGARLVQGEQELTGDTITVKIDTGDIYAENETQSIMVGKDSDGKPTKIKIQSHLQELDKETGTLIANGNAVINYGDYVAKGPKAVIYRKTDQLDRIVMTGRAQIEDPERKVSGDTVIITVNPKQFNAQGNVTTFIKAKKQQTATGGAASKSASGKATATAQPAGTTPGTSAWEQEQMIEQATQNAKKQP